MAKRTINEVQGRFSKDFIDILLKDGTLSSAEEIPQLQYNIPEKSNNRIWYVIVAVIIIGIFLYKLKTYL